VGIESHAPQLLDRGPYLGTEGGGGFGWGEPSVISNWYRGHRLKNAGGGKYPVLGPRGGGGHHALYPRKKEERRRLFPFVPRGNATQV